MTYAATFTFGGIIIIKWVRRLSTHESELPNSSIAFSHVARFAWSLGIQSSGHHLIEGFLPQQNNVRKRNEVIHANLYKV